MTDHAPLGEVRFELLGGFRAVVDGRPVAGPRWPTRRCEELVALLALAPGHRLRREQVIEALWPHLEPGAGAANLRKAAHHARKALDRPDAVTLAGGAVALCPDATVRTDVEEFEDRARAALDGPDPGRAGELAATLPGEPLPDARYADWAREDRERVAALRLRLLRRAGEWARIVELDPTDEQAHRELMRAALADGARHEAIRWYGRLRAALAEELDVTPDPRTREVYLRCVEGLDAPPPVLRGREVELATAGAVLDAPDRGTAGALLVFGPAGIGKSTLCAHLADSARERGATVATVHAVPDDRPYGPVARAVAEVLRGAGDHPGARLPDTIGEAHREVLLALVRGAVPDPDAGLTRHRVIGAVRRLFEACPSPGTVLVVDDAHRMDEATAEVCTDLARDGARCPVTIVLALRPEQVPSWVHRLVVDLARAHRSARIDLGPLAGEDIRAVAVAAATTRPDDGVLDRIAELSRGNPFFAEELARACGAREPLAVPMNVWSALTARFLDLAPAHLSGLRTLALAADELDPAEVASLLALPEPDSTGLLDDAVATGALVVADGRYRFRHDLVRDALIEQIPPHRRAVEHRAIADRLGVVAASPALVAAHWRAGHRPDRARPWLLDAAHRAAALGAFPDALGHLDRLLADAPDDRVALRRRAEVLDALGDPRAPAAYDRAAHRLGDPDAQDLRAMQALAELKQGDGPRAMRTVEGLTPATVAGRLAQALTHSGAAALGYTDPARGSALSARSRRVALESGDRAAIVVASWAQAAAAHARGELRESVQADLLDTADLPELAVRVFDGHLCMTQRLLYGARPYPDVIAYADALGAEARRLGAARADAFARTLRGEAELLAGRLDDAERDLRDVLGAYRRIGATVGESLALQRLAELALLRERPEDATALLDDALAAARETDIGFHLFDRIYGTRLTATTDPAALPAVLDRAEAAVRGPLETCPGCRITFAVPAAIAAARSGDLERADRHARAAEYLAGVVMRLPAWDAALTEVHGHLRAAAADPAGAAARFADAAAGFARAGQPLDEARCRRLAER